MSVDVDAAASTALNSSGRGAQFLVELDFVGGTIYYTTNAVDIAAQGHTYTGYGNLVDVAALGESENSADEKISLGLSIVNIALIAACMGDVTTYRGKAVRLYIQFTDSAFQPAGAPIYVWRGYMEPVVINRQPAKDGPSTGRIGLPCRRAGMARARRAEGMRLSDAQQQATYAGDKFYEYLQTIMERPTPIVTLPLQRSLAEG